MNAVGKTCPPFPTFIMFIETMRIIIFVTVVALLGAKARTMEKVKVEHPEWDESTIRSKLVGYCSGKANFNFLFS